MSSKKDEVVKSEINFSKGLHSALPKGELMLYSCIITNVLIYICYSVYVDSKLYVDDYGLKQAQGWSILDANKDPYDSTWDFWLKLFLDFLPLLCAHIIIGRFMELMPVSVRKYVMTGFSMSSLCYLVGWKTTAIVILQSAVCFCVSLCESFVLTCFTAVVMGISIKYAELTSFYDFVSYDDEQHHEMRLTLHMKFLFYTSFCIDRVKRTTSVIGKTESLGYSFTDLLYFTLYLPPSLNGPFITYEDFRNQVNMQKSKWTKYEISPIIILSVKVMIWGIFLDLCYHFFYVETLLHADVLEEISEWTIGGILYISCHFFMMRYMVLWGIIIVVCKTDRIELPKLPQCVSYIYIFSDLWLNFDRGFYNFIKLYIYIPLGGSHHGSLRQLCISIICFLFVYSWHGLHDCMLFWIAINCAMSNLLFIARKLINNPYVQKIENEKLSPAMVRRLHAVCTVPVYRISSLGLIYFFKGKESGDVIFNKYIFQFTLKECAITSFIMYCAVQVSMEIKRIQHRQRNLAEKEKKQ